MIMTFPRSAGKCSLDATQALICLANAAVYLNEIGMSFTGTMVTIPCWFSLCTTNSRTIFTARVRTYDGRLCFHRCVSVQGGGVPGPGRGGPRSRSR